MELLGIGEWFMLGGVLFEMLVVDLVVELFCGVFGLEV